MKRFLTASLILMVSANLAFAGNKDRAGQAGAPELLINPWSKSAGWHGLNTANVRGLESLNLNVGGLAFTQKTELEFSHSIYLQGTGMSIDAFGFSQALGKTGGVLGLDVVAMGFGDIAVTTTTSPDGGLGTYKPQYINLALAYSKAFSNSIFGGIVVRGISEGITNVKSQGLALDAGIQYVTGDKKDPERIKFGIALRNIGTPMSFSGDALSFKTSAPESTPYPITVEQRAEQFELPSLLNIGASYDFRFGKKPDNDKEKKANRFTVVANFTSHSFSQDQIGAGAEYSLKEEFMVRIGYNYEKDLESSVNRANAYTGLAAGFSIEIPFKKGGPRLGIDYAYRSSNPFGGTHTLGVRINL